MRPQSPPHAGWNRLPSPGRTHFRRARRAEPRDPPRPARRASNLPRAEHRPLTRKYSAVAEGATSDWRRSGYGQPLLPRSAAIAAMGKKHKKHKAEWRSSYEGAEPAGGV